MPYQFPQLIHGTTFHAGRFVDGKATARVYHKVHQCLREHILRTIIIHVDVFLSFAQLSALAVHQQWHMCEFRRRPAEGTTRKMKIAIAKYF